MKAWKGDIRKFFLSLHSTQQHRQHSQDRCFDIVAALLNPSNAFQTHLNQGLRVLCEIDRDNVEFYLPQLVMFAVYRPHSAWLRTLLIDVSAEHPKFGLAVFWLLKSMLSSSSASSSSSSSSSSSPPPSSSSPSPSSSSSSSSSSSPVLQAISMTNVNQTDREDPKPIVDYSGSNSSNKNIDSKSATIVDIDEQRNEIQPQRRDVGRSPQRMAGKKHHRFVETHRSGVNTDLFINSFIAELQERCVTHAKSTDDSELFSKEMHLIDSLLAVGKRLLAAPIADRRIILSQEMQDLNASFMRESTQTIMMMKSGTMPPLYLPTTRSEHVVARIMTNECCVFNTKERCPFLVIVEAHEVSATGKNVSQGRNGKMKTMKKTKKKKKRKTTKKIEEKKGSETQVILSTETTTDIGNLSSDASISDEDDFVQNDLTENDDATRRASNFSLRGSRATMDDDDCSDDDDDDHHHDHENDEDDDDGNIDDEDEDDDDDDDDDNDDDNDYSRRGRGRSRFAQSKWLGDVFRKAKDRFRRFSLASPSTSFITASNMSASSPSSRPFYRRRDSANAYMPSDDDNGDDGEIGDGNDDYDDDGVGTDDHNHSKSKTGNQTSAGVSDVRRKLLPALEETEAGTTKESRAESGLGRRIYVGMVVKVHDDLKQELFALQLVKCIAGIFEREKLPLYARGYNIIPTSHNSGLIEGLTNAISIDSLKKKIAKNHQQQPGEQPWVSLSHYFQQKYGFTPNHSVAATSQGAISNSDVITDGNNNNNNNNNSNNNSNNNNNNSNKTSKNPDDVKRNLNNKRYKTAINNYTSSLAAYCIICYLLQVKDRHNGNIMLTDDGHLIHIDFAFFLTALPGGGLERYVDFKLTTEMVEVMGGPRSVQFHTFRTYCVRAMLAVRKHSQKLLWLVETQYEMEPHLRCFAGGREEAVEGLRRRLWLECSTMEVVMKTNALIDHSLDHWRSRWYDIFQFILTGIV